MDDDEPVTFTCSNCNNPTSVHSPESVERLKEKLCIGFFLAIGVLCLSILIGVFFSWRAGR